MAGDWSWMRFKMPSTPTILWFCDQGIIWKLLCAHCKQRRSWHNVKPQEHTADPSPLLLNLLDHMEKNNVSEGISRLVKERFWSNLPLTLSFTGNKQDWPKAKNKLFIWLSQQWRFDSSSTELQQTFPGANGISFRSGLVKAILDDGWVNCGPSCWFSLLSPISS